jgi:hypothetical protein
VLDRVARRYGCRPSDILAGDVAEWSIDLLVTMAGLDAEDQIQREIEHAKGIVFPVRVL